MITIGNFLFHYRNGLFPLFYLLLFVPSHPLMANFRLAALLGLLVASAGQLLRAITIGLEYIRRGGRARQVYADNLVQGGIFSHCRNPLYLGNFLILAGVGFASNSRLFLSIGIPFFAFAYWAIIAAEENYLRTKFGAEFENYCARVNRLLPNLSGLKQTLTGMQFNWRRLITAEYGSAFIWMAAIPLLALKNLWQEKGLQAGQPLVWVLAGLFLLVSAGYVAARLFKKGSLLPPREHPAPARAPANY